MIEHKMTHPVLSWLAIIGTAVVTAAWGVVCYYAIKDPDRQWNVGQFPDTPAASYYSTVTPERPANAPTQLPRVPTTQEAKP